MAERKLRSARRRSNPPKEPLPSSPALTDNHPFASVNEAATMLIEVGGRIMVRPDGGCEEALPFTEEMARKGNYDSDRRRQVWYRYEATLLQKGAREEIAELVRQHGRLHEGSGWIVWEADPGAMAK